jgi:hypothetical protein
MNLSFILGNLQNEWFWLMSQTIVFTLTLMFIGRQIRIDGNSHLVNSIKILNDTWNDETLLKARRTVCQRYISGESNMDRIAAKVGNHFEEIGIYYRRKALPLEIIWEMYSYTIEHYWLILENAIIKRRKEDRDDTYFENFEKLYQKLLSYNSKKGADAHKKVDDEVKKFIKIELEDIGIIEEVRPINYLPGTALNLDLDPTLKESEQVKT